MQFRRHGNFIYLALVLLFCSLLAPAYAQNTFPTVFPKPILILDQERLFLESDLGQAILNLESENKALLINASGKIARAFEAEELKLTELRDELSAEEFQLLSEDFNSRVQVARQSQIADDIANNKANEDRRRGFLGKITPYLVSILQKYQASAIINQRSVFLFTSDLDITQEAIELIDQEFEANPGLLEE